MKKIFLGLLVVLLSLSICSQPTTKEDYQRRSKNQKTWAWLLTGGGMATLVGGVIVVGLDETYFPSETVGSLMIVGGGAATAGGIFLFSASKRNQGKGNDMALFHLKMEKATVYGLGRAENYHFPAVSVKIKIK